MQSTSRSGQIDLEVPHLLARVIHRLLTRQKSPDSAPNPLDVPAKSLLSVTTTVNNHGEHGEP